LKGNIEKIKINHGHGLTIKEGTKERKGKGER